MTCNQTDLTGVRVAHLQGMPFWWVGPLAWCQSGKPPLMKPRGEKFQGVRTRQGLRQCCCHAQLAPVEVYVPRQVNNRFSEPLHRGREPHFLIGVSETRRRETGKRLPRLRARCGGEERAPPQPEALVYVVGVAAATAMWIAHLALFGLTVNCLQASQESFCAKSSLRGTHAGSRHTSFNG